jgi:hypothetical protein
MNKKIAAAAGLALSLSAGQALAQTPTCADLNWSADVLAENPDIGQLCQAVYEKNGKLYAKTTIEVVRVRGNRITFRPIRTDGSRGESRATTVGSGFRAEIGGRNYRVSDLMRGQQLNVYLPEDRFALAFEDTDGLDEGDMLAITAATAVAMPSTASPLFLIGAAGGAFLGLGAVLGRVRRRRN